MLFQDHKVSDRARIFFPGSDINSKYIQGYMDHYPVSHSEFYMLRRCPLNVAKTNLVGFKKKS